MAYFNVLMRTSDRPKYFERAFKSVINQSHNDFQIICSYDNMSTWVNYLAKYKARYNGKIIPVKVNKSPDKSFTAPYNLYMNTLLQYVKKGWICFMDDDNYFAGMSVLTEMDKVLIDPDCLYLTRFNHGKIVKPEVDFFGTITRKQIDSLSIFYHSKYKHVRWDGMLAGDFRFATKLSTTIPKTQYVDTITGTIDNLGLFGKKQDLK